MTTLNDKDIRPTNLIKKYHRLIQNDLRELKKEKLILVNCPACNSKRFEHKYQKMEFKFVSCKKCNTIFINPRPTESSLEKFYTKTKSSEFWNKIFEKTKETRKEKIFKPRIKLVFDILKKYDVIKCKKMVEVGAGYGWFCELAKEKKLAKKIIAIEPSPEAAKICRKIEGIEVIESTIEKNLKKLQSDFIVSFESVNLLFNPRFFLQSCYNGLKKNGVLIFSLTNYLGFDIQILQEKSNYIIPNILNLFNPNSIRFLLKSIGFRNVKVITPGLMDVQIILNKIKNKEIDPKKYPFFQFLLNCKSEQFIDDLQGILQKNNLSSHMVVSAQK